MRILVSPVSAEEAKNVIVGGADIVDIKNPAEGSLGASFPWVIRDIVKLAKEHEVISSATLGDLPFKPGTASLAASGLATLGVDYIKVGLQGATSSNQVAQMMGQIVRAVSEISSQATVVAAGYGDYARFGGPSPETLVEGAVAGGCRFVMLDTGIKDGLKLTDHLTYSELDSFVQLAKQHQCQVALAGSIGWEEISIMQDLGVDLIGIRGAVCQNRDRSRPIDSALMLEFMQKAKGFERQHA